MTSNLKTRKFAHGLLLIILLALSIISCKESKITNEIEEEETYESKYEVETISDVDIIVGTLKQEILNSKTEIHSEGVSYYVSNNGNDSNDGKSPATAWATLSKINTAYLVYGSVVHFERGGTWRGILITKSGISYSAYGEGEKPKIYGSLQNYSVKENWKITNIPNVYVYDKEFDKDAGLLVFNEGEAWSYKKVIDIDGFSGSIGDLKKDLEMYHNVDDKKIYLYSANGNPADRFSSIEFCLKNTIVQIMGDNTHIDNLCVKYGGAHGIASGSRNNLTITNCELGWIGGSILSGNLRYGNAIQIWGSCKNFKVDNCYIYQIYDTGITHQYKNETSTTTMVMENVEYSNNLIEYCTWSIEYYLNQPNSPNDIMKNIRFTQNVCRFAGYGWGEQRPNKYYAHIKGGIVGKVIKFPAENFFIDGNIFDRSGQMLLSISALKEGHLPEMKNNIYIQENRKDFGMYGVDVNKVYPFNLGIGELLKQKGIEENPTIIIVD
ncbi:hypothetical protein [Sunxiuqinia indica]|uniref:hypothetical protein n=1 Tax=Sunxiuqinia indica TaxID=2692584 RepID=UPI001358190E|nr:hypothetical protein [Sunxiuqinia indica]